MSIVLSKSFSPNIIVDGGITTLTFTIVVDAVLPVISFSDLLPSALAYIGNPIVPVEFSIIVVPTIGTNGTIKISGSSVPIGTYLISFDITNLNGQLNPSCDLNPSAFTNPSPLSNLQMFPFPPQFIFDGITSCLIINKKPSKKRRKSKSIILPTICLDKYDNQGRPTNCSQEIPYGNLTYRKFSEDENKCCYTIIKNK